MEWCKFYQRRIEPLAFSLRDQPYNKQEECPLFGTIPREVRDLVYEFAMTDCTSHPPNCDNVFRRDMSSRNLPKPTDIALSFLQTCRAVYLEAYKLPFLLNPLIIYDFNVPSYPEPSRLAPWQYALIQSIDISLQQVGLEQGELRNWLSTWMVEEKHGGAYIIPRYFQRTGYGHWGLAPGCTMFGLKEAMYLHRDKPQDGDEIPVIYKSVFYDKDHPSRGAGSVARAMVARPLTRLTIRLSHTDWWTWTDDPSEPGPFQRLRLDPSFGDTEDLVDSVSADTMVEWAARRRTGQHPDFGNNWGSIIARMPDLKTFELILETFEAKKKQLVTVVECAKTWRFPLLETSYEMVWDGRVESANWQKESEESAQPTEDNGPDYDPFDDPMPEVDPFLDEMLNMFEIDEVFEQEEAEEGTYWMDANTAFEVRIVRFTRRKM